MKKFLINIAIFFAIVAFVDFSLGKLFHYLQASACGRTGAEYYVCEKATEDIIIMGSSRASHHYVPEIISEKLGMSCFNAGQDGNGIILHYGRWKLLSKRHAPKLIIYDLTTEFDLAVNDNMTYIDRLKPFCEDATVNKYVSALFPAERFKLLSGMYCFNYKFLEILFDYKGKTDFIKNQGYVPLYGHIRDEIVNNPRGNKIENIPFDADKIYYLELLLTDAKQVGTKVVFVVSPSWKGGGYSREVYTNIEAIANQYGVQFIDYIDSEICDTPDYFEDSAHLNDMGARVFTIDFTTRIQI